MAYVLEISLRLFKAEFMYQVNRKWWLSCWSMYFCAARAKLCCSYSTQILTQARVTETPWHSIIKLHNTTINIAYGDVYAQLLHIGTIGSAHYRDTNIAVIYYLLSANSTLKKREQALSIKDQHMATLQLLPQNGAKIRLLQHSIKGETHSC